MPHAHGFEKTREAPDVPHQAFHLDFLTDVEGGIRAKRILRIRRIDDQGDHAKDEGLVESEAGAQLGRHKRVHRPQDCAACQQIDPRCFKLTGTGAGEHENEALLELHEFVHDLQQLRDPLDFVDDDWALGGVGGQRLPETLRCCAVEAGVLRINQVDPERLTVLGRQPGGLARASWAEQKVAGGRGLEEPFE